MFGGGKKKGDEDDDAKKDEDDKKEDEDGDDSSEAQDDDEDGDDVEPDMDPEEYDENGQPYSDRAINWSLSNFGDKSGTRFFKYAGDRTPIDIKEMRRKRRWRVNLKNVFYQHEWTGPESDIFLQFNIGYAFKLRRVQSYVKGPTGPKQKVVKLVPSGGLGEIFRTPLKRNVQLHEEVSFASLEATTEQEFSYLDLYENYLRVEVWDQASTCPNTFLGEFQVPLVNIARGGLNHVWTISNTVMQKRKKVLTDVAIVRFVCMFQEVLDFDLRLQNWSAKLRTSMMRTETTAKEGDVDDDEEIVRKPYLTFLLGQRNFFDPDSRLRSSLHHAFDKTFAKSLKTALVYSQADEFVVPTFRTIKRLCFRGTRTELEDQELRIKVFTTGGIMSGPKFVGEGSVSLEGAATGVSTTAPIAWTNKKQEKGLDKYVAAGDVSGAISVTAFRTPLFKEMLQVGSGMRGAPLWREFLQTGNVQPPELKVYKPYEYCYLCIKIINCHGLAAVDEEGSSDPFVMCVWAGQVRETSHRKKQQ